MKVTFLIAAFATVSAFAGDLGFRYQAERGRCEFEMTEGGNPGFLGECGILEGADLDGKTLVGNLRGIKIKKSSLRSANLSHSDLTGAVFEGSNLQGVIIQNALLHRTDFSDSNLEGASFAGSELKGALIYRGIQGRNADFRKAILENVDFGSGEDVDLSGANFEGARIGPIFCNRDQNLRNANFRNADLSAAIQIVDSLLEGAIYNSNTLLPFSERVAQKLGMVKVD